MEYSGPTLGECRNARYRTRKKGRIGCEQNSQAPEHERIASEEKHKGDVHRSFDTGKWLAGKGWRLQGKGNGSM